MLTKWSYVNARLVGIPLVAGGAALGALASGVDLSSVDWLIVCVVGVLFGHDVIDAEHTLVGIGVALLAATAGALYGAASPDPSTATKCGVVALLLAPWALVALDGRLHARRAAATGTPTS